MARGVILNPDPPTSRGAIVGNKNNHISLGTLTFLEGDKDENIDDNTIFIYINNLGHKLCEGYKVDFDVQLIDKEHNKRIAINVVPEGECVQQKS